MLREELRRIGAWYHFRIREAESSLSVAPEDTADRIILGWKSQTAQRIYELKVALANAQKQSLYVE